ncbi:MAG TPA: phosphoribosyltransferase family protein [Propionibacteriaceae bacterium]|nr:phosphoribosyltransferase family protein [Propionibacteriaceae bacterium]
MFRDRAEAAGLLAKRLASYKGQNPLVLAIPRGAVPMAKIIAEQLDGDFDVVLVRKLGAPYEPELAIGSVDESGHTYLSPFAGRAGADDDYIAHERAAQLAIITQRRRQYTPVRPPIDPAGRVVIVVDDGLATGSTMIAALHSLRTRHPAKLVCAVPVSPRDTLELVRERADEVVCLDTPAWFQAVGNFYDRFQQVTDAEVMELLRARPESTTPTA